MTSAIERSITRLGLHSQGEFVALLSAIQMQIESGQPVGTVVGALADALLALAKARGLDCQKLRLAHRLQIIRRRIPANTGIPGEGGR